MPVIFRQDLAFTKASHLRNPWNENKAVKVGRDGQVRAVRDKKCRVNFTPLFR